MKKYAEIIIDLISDAVDRPFDYRIPPRLQGRVVPGSAVRVPFGRRNYQGYVIRLKAEPAVTDLREISAVEGSEPLLQEEQLALLHWMAHRYYCRKIEAI
ncbi:MAG: primosomal protein N', partial [Firmicutes bacterium]|nr:primosomal protein N' [Bacillota bacterium]